VTYTVADTLLLVAYPVIASAASSKQISCTLLQGDLLTVRIGTAKAWSPRRAYQYGQAQLPPYNSNKMLETVCHVNHPRGLGHGRFRPVRNRVSTLLRFLTHPQSVPG